MYSIAVFGCYVMAYVMVLMYTVSCYAVLYGGFACRNAGAYSYTVWCCALCDVVMFRCISPCALVHCSMLHYDGMRCDGEL